MLYSFYVFGLSEGALALEAFTVYTAKHESGKHQNESLECCRFLFILVLW